MPVVHLTDITVKNLQPPEAGQVMYTDHDLPGFGVRVSQGGVKAFVLVHPRTRVRTTLGRYPVVKLQQARQKATQLLAERALGKDEAPKIGFEEALDDFISAHLMSKREGTAKETKRLLNKHFLPKLRYEKLHQIPTHTVTKIIDGLLDTPSEAMHAYAAARLLFRWAVQRRLLAKSPLEGVPAPSKAIPRARVLSPEELAKVFFAAKAEQSSFGSIVQLLILLGQRCGETARLTAEMVDFDGRVITLPAAVTKNGREHRFPFGRMAQQVLESGAKEGLLFPARGGEEVFSGWSKCKKALDAQCKIAPWTLHDLRRTFATNVAAIGTPIQVTERLLNHVSGASGGIVAVYQRHSYEKEMRDAINAWEKRLAALLRQHSD